VRKDGQIRWIRNKHVPRRNPSGRIVAYYGLVSDITEKKRADDDLRTAQSQLMQAEKLHSIGQLAAGVAHEVKNPLQVILIGLQFVSDSSVAADPQMRAVIQEMLDAVQRANGVIQDLLDFASPRELGMQPRSLNAVLEKAIRFVRHDITKSDIKVVKHLAEGLPEAIVDPTKIEQAFINLITNACHAMPGGGTLTVTTRERIITAAESPRHDSGDRSGIRFRPGEPVITIEIRDTGVGVAPEKLSRIFEPFFTTKSTGKGTGLGLSVTQKIVDLHRGKISIENHPEGGVIASITLKAIKQGDDARKERP
jgi:signal transduction histidine kinase